MNIVQEYPKDADSFDYAYISLGSIGGVFRLLNPFRKLIYQVVDEDSELSIHDSASFRGGYYGYTGVSENNKLLNHMVQNGWEQDGTVYSPISNNHLPRYRKPKEG